MNFYLVTTEFEGEIQKNGNPKAIKKTYVVQEETVLNAERKIHEIAQKEGWLGDFRVTSVKESNIEDVFLMKR